MNTLRNMLQVCGISDMHIAGANERPTIAFIETQGFNDMEDFAMMRVEGVAKMTKNHNADPDHTSRLGAVHVRKVQALIIWAKDQVRHGETTAVANWNQVALVNAISMIDISARKTDTVVANPGRLEVGSKWVTWDILLENYIGSIIGESGVPLDYVIRRDQAAGWTAANEHDRLKYAAVQTGPAWDKDTMKVYVELKQACLLSEGWTWIKDFDNSKDGCLAVASLRLHYEGVGEVNKRVTWAHQGLKDAHYKSEHTFSFEKYATTLKEAFSILNDNGSPHSDTQMVRLCLTRSRCLTTLRSRP